MIGKRQTKETWGIYFSFLWFFGHFIFGIFFVGFSVPHQKFEYTPFVYSWRWRPPSSLQIKVFFPSYTVSTRINGWWSNWILNIFLFLFFFLKNEICGPDANNRFDKFGIEYWVFSCSDPPVGNVSVDLVRGSMKLLGTFTMLMTNWNAYWSKNENLATNSTYEFSLTTSSILI